MARSYTPGPKRFVFSAGDGDDRQVLVDDPQEAYAAFSAFFRERNADAYTIGDESAGQRLVLMPGRGVIARFEDAEVVRDGNIITSRKPDDLPAFMAEVVRHLGSGREAQAQRMTAVSASGR